jgi:hypothetical protein
MVMIIPKIPPIPLKRIEEKENELSPQSIGTKLPTVIPIPEPT